ncbi:MAG: ParB N-terminal domain-containing protein [Thiomargarita sp.]|nr:ParB N-terminal domain-containing protein [Thiomargarita sp.]
MSKYGESLKFYLVDVKDIKSNVARSTFDEQELEKLANLILATGCLLQPLILKQTGPMSYKVLEGHKQFYAAVKAKEKEPILAEMVSAFVVKQEIEESAIEQTKIFNKPASTAENIPTNNISEHRITNLETRLDNGLQEVKANQKQDTQRLEEQFKQLQSQIPKRLEPLETFNTLDVIKLVMALKTAGMSDKKATEIAKQIEKSRKKPFIDIQNIIDRKIGITPLTMVKIVNTWSKIGFFF